LNAFGWKPIMYKMGSVAHEHKATDTNSCFFVS